jgi:hypothetical protein
MTPFNEGVDHSINQPINLTTGGESPTAEITPLVERMLRRALELVQSKGAATSPDLRLLLHAICGKARARHLFAEQLIIIIKVAWYAMPEAYRDLRWSGVGDPRTEVLARVITVCIEEYYAIEDG